MINQDWSFFSFRHTLEKNVIFFCVNVYKLFDESVPRHRCTSCKNYPRLFTSHIVKSINLNVLVLQNFQRIRAKIRNGISLSHKSYIAKIESEVHMNSKNFFNYTRNKREPMGVPNRTSVEDRYLYLRYLRGQSWVHFYSTYLLMILEN